MFAITIFPMCPIIVVNDKGNRLKAKQIKLIAGDIIKKQAVIIEVKVKLKDK